MFTNVLVFSTYATYVVMSFMMLVMIFMLMPQAQVSAERINEVLDTKAARRPRREDQRAAGPARSSSAMSPSAIRARLRMSWSISASR